MEESRVKIFLALLVFIGSAHAQPTTNVTPQTVTWLESNIQVDVRLKGPPSGTNLFPTVKVITSTFAPLNSQSYTYAIPCWNSSSSCPKVTAVTVQVYLKLPTGRSNVTRFTGLCGSLSECVLPAFPEIQPKPGQSYRFNYSRVNASWNEPPVAK